jgi:DNA polymerase I-like protein with 3'-5' exonuclease and polymerase domains
MVLDSMAQLQKVMRGMAAYKKKAAKFVKEHGYLVINEQTGHRIYWPEWPEWKAVEDTFTSDFWEEFRIYHQGTDDEVCRKVAQHRKKGEAWLEKNVLNYPIQGGSAIVLKQAAADLFEWVVRNKLFNKVLFCVFVHDEIDCECPEQISGIVTKKVEQIMEKAAGRFYKRLPIPSEGAVNTYWEH